MKTMTAIHVKAPQVEKKFKLNHNLLFQPKAVLTLLK
jgi:hypothetical protein